MGATRTRNVRLNERDKDILRLLDRTPVSSALVLKASAVFAEPFEDLRRVRERMQALADGGCRTTLLHFLWQPRLDADTLPNTSRDVQCANPSKFKGASNPVENVSWDDAMEFCEKLSAKQGKTYRLPTMAEWEYACRAGTTTRYSFGDDPASLGKYAWYRDNSDRKTHPVGKFRANGFGLYDMHGKQRFTYYRTPNLPDSTGSCGLNIGA